MAYFEWVVQVLSRMCDRIAQVGVVAMMLLAVGNMVLRPVWKPIVGTYDLVGFMGAIVVAFAIAYCAVKKGHIRLELLMTRLPKRVQGIVGGITGILSLGIFAVVTWQCLMFGNDMRRVGELSMTAHLPFYPYIYGIAFGCALLCLVILIELIKSLAEGVKG